MRQRCSPPTVARESDDRAVLSAPPSPYTSCVIRRRYEQSVRSTVVEAADQAATSSLEKKVEAEAAAKPSMRSTRVARSTSSPSANGARRPPSVEAWARPHTLCIRHIRHSSSSLRLRLHSLWQSSIHARPPGTRLQRNVGPPSSHTHRRLSQVPAWRLTSLRRLCHSGDQP